MEKNIIEFLKKNHLFNGLSEIRISQILSKINYKIKSYRKNDLVFLNNEYCKDLVILLDGSLRSGFYKDNGSSVMINRGAYSPGCYRSGIFIREKTMFSGLCSLRM